MLTICLCSDNHNDISSINKILSDNPKCDYYFHLGDSNFDEETLRPFISVRGNNDFDDHFPYKRIIEIKNHKILLIHGTNYTYNINILANKAISEGCDTIFFGHTHKYLDEEYNGIRLINPGSCFMNRDFSSPCYAIVTIDDDSNIYSKRINLE